MVGKRRLIEIGSKFTEGMLKAGIEGDDNTWPPKQYLKYYPSLGANWSRATAEVSREKPYAIQRVEASMTSSQMQSKLWILEELENLDLPFNNAAIIGGWYCHYLCAILFDNLYVKFICNYDIDKDSQTISYKFNRRYKDAGVYVASCRNLFLSGFEDRQLEQGPIDLVINPSAEHMFHMRKIFYKPYFRKLRKEENLHPIFLIQSTDEPGYDDHINCVNSIQELKDQVRMKKILFKGEKILHNGMKRFMIIGK